MLNQHDEQYHNLLKRVLKEDGEERMDRTGTGIISTFSEGMVFDVSETIPLLTTKKVSFSNILHETLWMFVRGSTNIKYLTDNNVNIWNAWANSDGELGPIYGKQARNFQGFRETKQGIKFEGIDQIKTLIENLKNDPYSRRHIITLWNPATAPINSNDFGSLINSGYSALPVCHGALIQFYVNSKGLSLKVYVRSNDLFLGAPYNMINYTLLLYMIANVINLKPYKLHYDLGDAHIYLNHIPQVETLLSRTSFEPPKLLLQPVENFDDYTFDDFKLIDYQAHPNIKAPISI